MSGISVSASLRIERERYLRAAGTDGGTAPGFRKWVKRRCEEDPRLFPSDALRDEAATKAWETQPRKRGPDLFSIAGEEVPEFLVRPAKGFVEDDVFEKVHADHAIVADYFSDADIKMRKAVETAAAAHGIRKRAEAARTKAGGSMTAFLRDLKD
jgi:hypothetical protein